MMPAPDPLFLKTIVLCLISIFLAILFLQSGLDKVMNWKGNLDWLKGHFKASILKGTVPLCLGLLTLLEMAAGIFSLVGAVTLYFGHSEWAILGMLLSAISLIALFFGQRVAQDYAGAQSLVAYFLLTLVGLILFIY